MGGGEPVAIADIKAYKPESSSVGSGQVLQSPYPFDKARMVIREMADLLALDLVDKRLVTNQVVLTVGYDIDNLTDPSIRKTYRGPVTTDRYGRSVPKHAHGTENLEQYTSSAKQIVTVVLALFDRIVDKKLLVRRAYLAATHVIDETSAPAADVCEQLDLFTDYAARQNQEAEEAAALGRERKKQEAVLAIKKKFGKNAIMKGTSLEEGATTINRNNLIGGHRA